MPLEPAGPDPTHDLDLIEDHDRGLAFDLGTMLRRRGALKVLAGAGAAAVLAACGSSSGEATSTTASGAGGSSSSTTAGASGSSTTSAAAAAAAECTDTIPEETAGPYPGDGSNGPDVLSQSGVVRRDITTSFGDSSGTAEGVPVRLELTVLDRSAGCAPLVGGALYLWHADRDGRYSMYSQGVTDQNYLRGVQETDDAGLVVFDSIFPGCYDGRWPHAHFEIYPSLSAATSASDKLVTSQLAFPQNTCEEVYSGADGYSASVSNLARTSLSSDMVFRDGSSLQVVTMSGSLADGYTARLTITV